MARERAIGVSSDSDMSKQTMIYLGRNTWLITKIAFKDSGGAVSRRTLVAAVAAGAGAMALGLASAPWRKRGRSRRRARSPAPPRDFGPNGAPTTYFTDPDVLTVDPSFPSQPNAADPATVDRRAVGGGAGLERARPLSRLERHSQQSATAMAGRRRSRQRVPPPSNNSNGNTFDFQGRQISCEHLTDASSATNSTARRL